MKKIRCTKICVDCLLNDNVDIRCGGPQFLGFDFWVKDSERKEMFLFIEAALKEYEIPIINQYFDTVEEIDSKDVFTKKKIIMAIKRDSTYLKEEALLREKSPSYTKK